MESLHSFQKIYLEIGNICNLQCSFCPEVERKKWQLNESDLRSLLEKVKEHAQFVCFHVMGEPLAHPQFPQFVRIAEMLQVPVEITTNGTLLSEVNQEALLNPIVRQVNFSLQSFFDNFPQANGVSYWQKIFAFTQLALTKRPELYINYRLWNLTSADKEDQKNEALLQAIEQEFEVQINRNVDPRLRKSKKLLGRLYLHYDTRFRWPNPSDAKIREQGSCYGTRSHIAVHANGTVVPCCLDKEARIPLGNLLQDSLEEIMAGERFQKMRKGFETGHLVEDLCQRCDYATRFNQ